MGRFFLFIFLVFLPSYVYAEEKIVLIPAFQELSLDAHQTLAGSIEIQNQTSTDQEFEVRSVQFSALDAAGGVVFLGSEINNESLPPADFLFFEERNLSVPAGETRNFPFQVRDSLSLSPGGHYAAIVFQTLPTFDSEDAEKIAFRQILSSLLFLEKTGGAVRILSLEEVAMPSFQLAMSKNLTLIFENKGNVHLTPRGVVKLQDPLGQVKTCAIINESSSLLLPGQKRDFSLALNCQPLIPGVYTLLVEHRFDGEETFTQAKTRFFVVPYSILLLLVGAGVLLALWRKKKKFKQKT